MENSPKKEKKQGKLEMVLNFIERQQDLRRQDKQERQRRIEEEEREKKRHLKRFWWAYVLIMIGLFAFIFTMSFLEKQGII